MISAPRPGTGQPHAVINAHTFLRSSILIATIFSTALVASQPACAQSAPSPAPGGGGSALSAESIVLEYQVLAESASYIDQALKSSINFDKEPRIVVATASDVGAIVQLRAVLGQASFVNSRVDQLTLALSPMRKPGAPTYYSPQFPCYQQNQRAVTSRTPLSLYTLPLPSAKGAAVGGTAIQALATGLNYAVTNAAGIQTLLQTAAGISAVNETVAPAAGSLGDASLINLIVLGLPGKSIYVPSLYAPGILDTSLKTGTLLGRAIADLEYSRTKLYRAADARVLSQACQAIAYDNKGQPIVDKDKLPIKANQATLNQIATEVAATSALVDAFEGSLFSGQPAPAPSPSASPGPGSPGTSATPTGGILSQLLYADYLLNKLGLASGESTLDPSKGKTYLLGVHALESGGNTLTKSNLFAGSHVFFSGEAVSTFNLIESDGSPVCSGIGFAYRGFVPEDRMALVVQDAQNPGDTQTVSDDQAKLVHFTSTCSAKR